MNLGWIQADAEDLTKAETAVILHEFGHVLGMLHEHQSPAGGGVPLKDVNAAIKFYGQQAGWDARMVQEQVIDPYNTKDVSSFSQVDRFSIMQYPMPASVTGLDYDIDYNYYLSDLDKAYMCIMYPRAGGNSHGKAPTWTFENALIKTGITRENPQTAQKILDAYMNDEHADKDGVDPTTIRKLFSGWCLKAHATAREERLRHFADNPTGDELGRDETPVINALPIDMCCTKDRGDSLDDRDRAVGDKGTSAVHALPSGRADAVIDENWLDRVEIPKMTPDDGYALKISWAVVPCPESATDTIGRAATPYQLNTLKDSLQAWANVASVEFYEAPPQSQADIIFTFQRNNFDRPTKVYRKTSEARSYTKFCTDGKDAPGDGQPEVLHTICYRGISLNVTEAARTAKTLLLSDDGKNMTVTNADFDRRSILHEIGHYLGLDHEPVGVYGYCVFNDNFDEVKAVHAKNSFVSTVFDNGSIMDNLRSAPLLKHYFAEKLHVRQAVRTVCSLSSYDQANIALLHPGQKLEGPGGPELIANYSKKLCLTDRDIKDLQDKAVAKQWHDFRTAYINALRKQTKLMTKDMTQIIQNLENLPKDAVRGVQHGLQGLPTEGGKEDASTVNKPLLEIIYEQLVKSMGPTGAQILTLQYPTRYLAKEEFHFELDGIYSNFIKPTVVSEAEFRLSDALYDAAAIVSAPNGRSLSTVYNQVLNNFVPKYSEADRKVREERERIRSWLLTEVGDQDPYYKYDFNSSGGGKGDHPEILSELNSDLASKNQFVRKMSRMEFASQLSQDYYSAQMDWEMKRDEMVADAIASKDPVKLNAVTRKLVHITQSEQGKLAMKNADSVVRGYSHIVREALGHLDVSTAAEILQDAKDAYRTSAVSSLYGANRVFPVLMSPVDWANALDTGFAPEDLAENPEIITMMIKTKSSALDVLMRQLSTLQSSMEGDPAALRAKVEQAAQTLEAAEANLHSKYMDSTIELAKIVVAISTSGASLAGEEAVKDLGIIESIAAKKASDLEVAKELDASASQLDPLGTAIDVVKQIRAVNDAQRNLQAATGAWNSKKVALARAEATSTKTDQAFLESSIGTLRTELVELNARLLVARQARQQNIALATISPERALTVGDFASKKPMAVGGGSRWQEINIFHDQEYSKQSNSIEASSNSSRWNVDFWIGSAGGSTETSTSSFLATNNGGKIRLEISMKVTTVTVDRSSWFQPQLFDNSKGYMRNNESVAFSTYPKALGDDATPVTIADTFRTAARSAPMPESFLPAYPVGYILCKDVYIKCSNMNTSTKAQRDHLLEKSQSSGGFLCFSYNTASETQKDSSTSAFEIASDGMIVRIPGPQILGYIQQIVPRDQSAAYDASQSLGKEFYLPPPTNPANSVNKTGTNAGSSGAAHGIQAPGTKDFSISKPNFSIRKTQMSAIQEAPKIITQGGDEDENPVEKGSETRLTITEADKKAALHADTGTVEKVNGVKGINGVVKSKTVAPYPVKDKVDYLTEDDLALQILHNLEKGDEKFKASLMKALGM